MDSCRFLSGETTRYTVIKKTLYEPWTLLHSDMISFQDFNMPPFLFDENTDCSIMDT